MLPETHAQARRAAQRRLGELQNSISAPQVLGLIFERLPGAEAWLTVGRLSSAWREWAAPKREAARLQVTADGDRSGAPWHQKHFCSVPLPLWLLKEQWPRLTAEQRNNAAVRAACRGDLETLQWLGGRLAVWEYSYVRMGAAAAGHLEVLRWLQQKRESSCTQGTTNWCPGDRSTCSNAASGGHVEVLQWLRHQDPPCPWDWHTCCAAADKGQLAVLQWLRQQQPPCPWNEYTCRTAACSGQLQVLQWLRQQQPSCPWDEATCCAAAGAGNLEMLQWLRQQQPPCPWNSETCCNAAKGGHLEVLQWLRQLEPPCPWNAGEILWRARQSGNAEMKQWVEAQFAPAALE